MHTRVCSSAIHSSQEAEAHPMSIDRGMKKQNEVYPKRGVLVSLKKERNPAAAYTTWMNF